VGGAHYAKFSQQVRGIFTVGAAGVGDAPTVGVLGPQQPSHLYGRHTIGVAGVRATPTVGAL
jgi:hypothetical protein